jgi:hypothetical protein
MFFLILIINLSCDKSSIKSKTGIIFHNSNINQDYEKFHAYIKDNRDLVDKNLKSREYKNDPNPLFKDLDTLIC